MLGRVVNPLGQAIDGQGEINTGKTKPIERVASGVMTRKSVINHYKLVLHQLMLSFLSVEVNVS